MAWTLWSQDIFTKGELSPFMYARATVNEYYNGLKTAQNVLTYPTGGAGKRFGTYFDSILNSAITAKNLYFQTFQYLNESVYQLTFYPGNIDIYLEGLLVANVSTSLTQSQVYNSITTTLGPLFRTTGQGYAPYDLTRTPNSGINISSNTTTTFTAASAAYTANRVYPVQFSVSGGTIMQTTPPISAGITYFAAATSTTTATLFATSLEAGQFLQNRADTTNAFTIQSLGTGTTQVIVQNTWTFAKTTFKNVPVYDFNGNATSYDALTFTPNAQTGAGVTITVSGSGYAPLGASYVGGAFIGGGGTSRITAVASATSFTVSVQEPFDSTDAIQGSLAFLAEPAWSDTRGWPQVCSSYQNRSLFANTPSLPNGFYASVVNSYTDFDDLSADDDSAISWYPTSDNMNYIKFIVPYRSITVHTNTGIYSSPLSDVVAITPSNFTLQLQDSTPADVLQPQAIDNQVIVLSGNDAHQMLWDGINNAYTSDVISVINEQTIRNPIDETAFHDFNRVGSRFVFIINENGSMAAYQTLLSQNVSGITPQIMEQSYGSASFIQCASSSDGRCWFVVQREIANAESPIALSAYTASTLKATASNFSQTSPTAVMFTTSGSLPTSSPQLVTGQYYWVIGTDADDFMVYLNQADALANTNHITFTALGSNSDVVPWPLTTIFTLEELTDDVYIDCAVVYNGTPASTITTGTIFNAQDVVMVGDGYGFSSPGEMNTSNEINFSAHGMPTDVSQAYIGFSITTIIEPMPLSISLGGSAKMTTLTRPKHVEWARFMFTDTIGGTINGVPIAIDSFAEVSIGEPPVPATGIFEMSLFSGWDDFKNPSFTIEHSDPFNIILLGVFYSVEV